MAQSKKKKNKNREQKRLSFLVAAVILGMAIVIPIIFLLISTLLNRNAEDKINETLYPIAYENYVERACEEYDVDICLVYAVIRTESGFDPDAVSSAGAVGLMQLMPDTFTWLQNYRTNFMPEEIMDTDELFDPEINTDYGVYLLSYLIERYDGNESLAICAYNAGYGNVDEWIENGTISPYDVNAEDVPFPETSNYLVKVTTAKEMYNILYFAETLSEIEE